MRHFGYSTGAIAKDDIAAGLDCLDTTKATAIEVSALRLHELPGVLQDVFQRDLTRFPYRSFHAPSRFGPDEEEGILCGLHELVARKWPVIAHPDTIHRPELWRELGPYLLLENMDQRKPIGRTADELDAVFDALPEAGLCFDLGHARQVDPSMVEAYRIVRRHGSRIRQLHLSDVDNRSAHRPLNIPALNAFMQIAPLIPRGAHVILEASVPCDQIPEQLMMAQLLFAAADMHRWARLQDQPRSRHTAWFHSNETSDFSINGQHLRIKPDELQIMRLFADVCSGDAGDAIRWEYASRSLFETARITGPTLSCDYQRSRQQLNAFTPEI